MMYSNVITLAKKTEATSPIAQTQTHHTIMDRKSVVQEKYATSTSRTPKR
jgi:molybdopterin-containing oxidoreductase family iron-sulfur binding subunit